jgi:DUF4097 and DUF4098 domain-containing protein YvlB
MLTKRISSVGQVVVLLTAVITLAGCDIVVGGLTGREVAKDEWTRSYSLAPDGQVEVVNVNGTIVATPADGPQVEIRAERTARASSPEAAKDLLKQIEIREDATPAKVRLETRAPSMLGSHTQVNYFIKVPKGISVRLTNSNGSVEVTGLQAGVKAETTNGSVTGRDLSGAVEATTTNGGVSVEVSAVAPDGIRLQTTNGGVVLRLPSAAKADVRASCVNGGISVSNLTLDASEQSRRRLDARLNGGGPKVELETTNGGIKIVGK